MRDFLLDRIWQLSSSVNDDQVYKELVALTKDLITLYDQQGRLQQHPFQSARNRTLGLNNRELSTMLRGSVCLVTGGLGCVGSQLVNDLIKFEVKQIIVVDNAVRDESFISHPSVIAFHIDVCNMALLEEIFSAYEPQFVFHTAAQRNPGLAEQDALQTVNTNIFGTLNLLDVCHRTASVKNFVFSSSGKASRYYTAEVYAASKKICEQLIDMYSAKGKIKYSIARFTHILDNSLMNSELEDASIHSRFVTVHAAGKYVTAQNVREASILMLNALLFGEVDATNFLIVRNLEWPAESLEMALYHIKHSGREIPVIFTGNPMGYSEKFFRGQMNWDRPAYLNLLINVYEFNNSFKCNDEDDIIISRVLSSKRAILLRCLNVIREARTQEEVKQVITKSMELITKDMLSSVPPLQTLKILRWALDPEWMRSQHITREDYSPIIGFMLKSLEGTRHYIVAREICAVPEGDRLKENEMSLS